MLTLKRLPAQFARSTTSFIFCHTGRRNNELSWSFRYLQGQINTQGAIISHLKEQIEKLRDYKEQVVVLKAEREHLENKVKTLTEKVKYLSTPVC